MNYRRDGEKVLDALSFLVQIKLFVKPGLTQLDFRYFQFSFISTIIKIQLFSYFKKYE
ncbi:hypothetical protein HMPREF9421_0039 [Streptococcus australis ATCC 700641]|uniref:Uncharacterized protein n=1 Tax=Streptococcus australis ATCC 700641 TaxID=888833 RepID=E7S7K4_9STRE|nr:hypothetical protein HMPREF9421_0039 [Streptococcus australis ATCC 700641]EGU67531.1 hypothetical protein HMPREF9961_0587 [Streptococcus australis ATCC 700641]